MSTLLLRLAAPMQSWGTQSRFRVRDTGLEPSKSGVIGLLCAALGKPREERPGDGLPTLAELARLRMGVRVDREGLMKMDYHTAGGSHVRGESYGVAKADGTRGETVLSNRYYLADADFLVGLEGDDLDLLARLDRALAEPIWPLFLGRKSFVPSEPPRLPDGEPRGPGLRPSALMEALTEYPWFRNPERSREKIPTSWRLVMDADAATGDEVRYDVPICFESAHREFGLRHVKTEYKVVPVLEE
ncbi:MAG: type I-E CRISPR-associated protein Cas5/CasD [Chloroflexi bacterium]|nr:type I-E CRISPR-associated protein Cas5/CasD [Chloroflexota bacterium]